MKVPQYTWTYVGGGGRNYTVSLFHGKRTGHVLLMLNGQILQIDFNVRDSKTYSFFIEDEFCEVRLERRGDEMYYFFEINKKVDTPRNRERKIRERKYLFQTLVFFGALILAAVIFTFTFQAYNKKLEAARAGAEAFPDSTVGYVFFDKGSVAYTYVVNNTGYSRHFFSDEASGDTLPPMPLEEGDEFTVRYYPNQPGRSRISFSQPTEVQKEKYLARTLAQHLSLHPEEHPAKVRCTLELALELYGPDGLADFLFQTSSPVASPEHNSDSYNRLVRDPAFQKAIASRCWQ